MRKIFNAVFLFLALFIGFLLYQSIKEPIAFKNDREVRVDAVKERLKDIRTVQEMFQDVTGKYAHSFDTLESVVKNDTFTRIRVMGDPDDPNFTGEITFDTIRTRAVIDSVNTLGIDLENLRYVPFGDDATFDITAKIIDYENTRQPVVQVSTTYDVFMGRYDARFKRYDNKYDPRQVIKFGDLTKPSVSGTWD
ncbi:MAG: hypothetical protein AAGF87_09325 [Bacteroidota bacterium]